MSSNARVAKYISGGVFLGLALIGLTAQSRAIDYSSTDFIIRDPIIGVGGGRATSTSFELYSSLGQTAIGESTSTDFILRSGFLYYPGPVTSTGGTLFVSQLFPDSTGGSTTAPTGTNTVIFSGRAYPTSGVTLLKDAQIAAVSVAGPDSNFQITLGGLSAGNYIFGVYGTDNKSQRSVLVTFPITLSSGVTTYVSGIFIAPTISVDKIEVRRGDNIAIFGQTIPRSNVTIAVSSDRDFFNIAQADNIGAYLYNFDTALLEFGHHSAKSKATLKQEISSFSKSVGFTVGTRSVASELKPQCPSRGDLGGDCQVNLVDFSILSYWYKRPLSDSFRQIELTKLNGDGKIDLTDFSIMAFYWTG